LLRRTVEHPAGLYPRRIGSGDSHEVKRDRTRIRRTQSRRMATRLRPKCSGILVEFPVDQCHIGRGCPCTSSPSPCEYVKRNLTPSLLQILALFESSAHPDHSPERETASLVFLDNIIRVLPLTYLDANDPDASRFTPGSVPVVHNICADSMSTSNKDSSTARGNLSHHDRDRRCSCIPPNTPLPPDHFSSYWSYPLPWDSTWSASEVRKEECRRLCWSALNLVTSYTSQCALFNREPPDLFLSDPANVRRTIKSQFCLSLI
jgi:hypothetical protein